MNRLLERPMGDGLRAPVASTARQDFTPSSGASTELAARLDSALQRARAAQPRRTYLGASRLGVACDRALQYEYHGTPVDPGRELSGRMLRIFERGHRFEACMATWLEAAGFVLQTHQADGQPFGFSAADGGLQGHADGVITDGPTGFHYPCLWENKCLGARAWREMARKPLAVANPVYAAQIAVYQAYLGLHQWPALFTALNADTMEIHAEWVPFDAALAQQMSDRAVNVIRASQVGDWLPRPFADASFFECRLCNWQDRCWSGEASARPVVPPPSSALLPRWTHA